jgi:integrase
VSGQTPPSSDPERHSADLGGGTSFQRKPRRALHREELAKLLNANPTPEIRDLITFGALTGMRRGEICGLQVKECTGGWFNVLERKTESAARRVPAHPNLKPIVARSSKGKGPDDFLLPWNNDGDQAGKTFGRFRVKAGTCVWKARDRRNQHPIAYATISRPRHGMLE